MSGRLDMRPAAVTARLARASELADLRPEHRLDAKIDLRPAAVTARLRIVSELSELCAELRRAGLAARPGPGQTST